MHALGPLHANKEPFDRSDQPNTQRDTQGNSNNQMVPNGGRVGAFIDDHYGHNDWRHKKHGKERRSVIGPVVKYFLAAMGAQVVGGQKSPEQIADTAGGAFAQYAAPDAQAQWTVGVIVGGCHRRLPRPRMPFCFLFFRPGRRSAVE